MKVRAVGRHLLIRTEKERVESKTAGGIVLPHSSTEREEEAVQIAEVVDVGDIAFDDQPETRNVVRRGVKIITQRYPGTPFYGKAEWDSKDKYSPYRLIMDTEVRGVIDDVQGAEIHV